MFRRALDAQSEMIAIKHYLEYGNGLSEADKEFTTAQTAVCTALDSIAIAIQAMEGYFKIEEAIKNKYDADQR
jgi:hypothetical protein